MLERFDVVTWDPRGRGLSSRPEDVARYGIDAVIADAEVMRRQFGDGDHEAWPLAGVRAYAEHGSTIGLLELVDSGHHVWNDANRRVLLALEAFLDGAWPAGTVR